MNSITVDKLRDLIVSTTQPVPGKKGKAFKVVFVKANGERREMRARLGMKRNLKGVGLKYDPADYRLLNVWECGNDYRSIPLDRVIEVKLPDKSKHLKPVLKGAYVSTLEDNSPRRHPYQSPYGNR